MSDVPVDPLGWEAWAPPLNPPVSTGLARATAEAIAALYWPAAPYLCAGLQWQAYALGLPAEVAVASVNTGVQSVQYQAGSSAFDAAMARALWFLDQAAGTGGLVSVPLSTERHELRPPLADMSWWIDP